MQVRVLSPLPIESDFYSGTVHATFRADLLPQPKYQVNAKLDRVDLRELVAITANLQQRFAGIASGDLTFTTSGVGREALAASLEGHGSIDVHDARLTGFDFQNSARAATGPSEPASFRLVSGNFSLDSSKIRFTNLRLLGPEDSWEATGTVDFSHKLDFRLRGFTPVPIEQNVSSLRLSPGDPKSTYRFSGSLESPQIVRTIEPRPR